MDNLLNISNDGQTLISVSPDATGKIIVPEGITHINDWVFSGSNVEEVILPSTLKTFGDRVFENCSKLCKISIPEGVEELTFCLFRGCMSLWQVTLPKSLSVIGTGSFEYCRNLQNICIPENVKEIYANAFGNCTKLNTCILPEGLETIGQGAFEGCISLANVHLPNTLKCITWQAFMGCKSLAYVYIPETVSEIGTGVFAGTNAFIEVDEKNINYSSSNGSLYDKKQEILYNYYASTPYCKIESPNTIKKIEGRAFQGINILREIVIKIPVESISNFPFYGCNNLRTIVLPDGLTKFDGCGACTNLEEIHLPDSIEVIYQCSFEDCTSLRHIKLPKNLKKLGFWHQGQCFHGCTSLESIELNEYLEFIAPSTFAGCENLREISLPSRITSIGYSAFAGCKKLKEIVIPPNVKKVDSDAFKDCISIEKVVCLANEIEISSSAFSGCINLRRLELCSFSISDLFVKFSDCINLEDITYIDNTTCHTISVKEIRDSWKEKLKLMSMYYYNMDMNIIPIKGSSKELMSFKKPYEVDGFSLSLLKQNRLERKVLMSMSWDFISGIALVLGWNRYQAIDVDNIHNIDKINDIIDSSLASLSLPPNYPWVVKSGSGKGFHIIYISDKVDREIDVYPFAPTKDICKNLEVRTGGVLVLPPSIHISGNNYEFLYKEVPTSLPAEIDTNRLNNFLLETCGNVTFNNFTYNGISFDLCEYKKIESKDYSHTEGRVSHSNDSIEWLSKCDSNHSYNSYAIRLVLGKDIEADKGKALKYFKLANNDYAFFNIASLMSVGFFCGSPTEVDYYISKINPIKLYSCDHMQGDIEPIDRIREIRKNAEKHAKRGDLFLFFDTETTGVPLNYKAPSSDTQNWPRLVQLAWILTDEEGNRIHMGNLIVKPDGFVIPVDATKVHGITTQRAKEEGVPLAEAIDQFKADLDVATLIVGHNIEFDKKIVGAEMIRLGMKDELEKKKSYCTMQTSIDFCKIPGKYGYKYPKLQELYRKLFSKDFEDAHNALSDIEATEKCFWELRKRQLI